MSRLTALVVFSLIGVALTACGSNDTEQDSLTEDAAVEELGFVGVIEGSNAFVALVAGGGEAVVYVCDGADDIAEWFSGPMQGAAIELTNSTAARVEATASDEGYRGTVTFSNGERHQFQAVPAEAGAGLFRITGPQAEADGVVGGWIINNEGELRGSLRVAGTARVAPPLPGASVTVDNTKYPVSIFKTPAPPAPGTPVPYPNTGTVAAPTR